MSSRQLRALIALVAVIGIAIVIGMNTLILGVGILVLGVIAIGVVLKRTADDDRSEREPRARRSRDDDETHSFEDLTDAGQPLTSRHRPDDAPEPLQTWTPPEPLQTWTPATNRSIEPTKAPAEPDNPWATTDLPESRPTTPAAPAAWDEPSDDLLDDLDPLDDLDRLDEADVAAEVGRLDDVDVVAEVERIDNAAVINEEVESSDDILAASEATQLTIGAGDNTELAKLLAKVQERLTAYE